MAKKKITLKEVGFMVVTWIIILCAINFVCGLIVQNRYIAVDPIDVKTAKTSYGYFKPNQDKIILFPGLEPYHVKINALGLRSVGINDDVTLAETNGKYKILATGDSLTFGLFVNDDDTYPYRLQNIITEEGKDAIVFNAGIGGGTITDYLYYLKVKGLQMKPDLVTLNFCTNDFGEMNNERPMYDRMVDKGAFDLAKTIKLAKFMRVFRKYELARRYKRWLKKTKDERVRQILKEESQDIDDIMYVAAFHAGRAVTDPYHEELKDYWQRYFDALDEVVELLADNDIDFLYVIYPDFATIYDYGKANYQEILIDYLKKKKIDYVDLRPIFQVQKENILDIYNNLPRDFHLSGLGNQILANEIYKRVKTKI